MLPTHLAPLLQPSRFVDSDNRKVIDFARGAAGSVTDPVEQAERLYYHVRDDFRYDPCIDYADPKSFRASSCIDEGHGFCIPKAALMAASARVLGIPARVGYADVRNHLATPRLLDHLGSDVFIYHGYAELWLNGRWVKATPCFNLELCNRFSVMPLDFDGIHDAMLHPYDTNQRLHMEYVRQRGVYEDVPFDEIQVEFRRTYPRIFAERDGRIEGDFAAEAKKTDTTAD
jgi:transglutaminase-like putative cysteine protease